MAVELTELILERRLMPISPIEMKCRLEMECTTDYPYCVRIA
jgi:hypothetical protein